MLWTELFNFGEEAGLNMVDAVETIDKAGNDILQEMNHTQFAITIDGVEHKAGDLQLEADYTCQAGSVFVDTMCSK